MLFKGFVVLQAVAHHCQQSLKAEQDWRNEGGGDEGDEIFSIPFLNNCQILIFLLEQRPTWLSHDKIAAKLTLHGPGIQI